MRMLYWPARSPFRASRLFPPIAPRSFKLVAASKRSSRLSACRAKPEKSFTYSPAAKCSEIPKGLTHHLARFIVETRFEDIPDAVRHEAKRTLLNWVGCAVGGCRQDTVTNVITALAPFAGQPQATLFGRTERMDILNAALVNGVSSHVLDFDDT